MRVLLSRLNNPGNPGWVIGRVNGWVGEWVSEKVGGWESEWASEWVGDRLSERESERVGGLMNGWMGEWVSWRASQLAGEWVSEFEWASKWASRGRVSEWVIEWLDGWASGWVCGRVSEWVVPNEPSKSLRVFHIISPSRQCVECVCTGLLFVWCILLLMLDKGIGQPLVLHRILRSIWC